MLLPILLMVFMGLTAVVLVVGLLVMARGGKLNGQYGNKLMRARVALQAIALALFAVLMMVYKQ